MATQPRRPTTTRRAASLILVGHGSHLSADSSAPVYAHAARIRALGVFDEVLEAFWKEEPCLRDAIDLTVGDDVWIVPVFLAEGYFTRQVVPRELGLDGPLLAPGRRRIRYCPPVGTHPAMADLILARARATAELDPAAHERAALLVIGHGTDRSETSGDTLYGLVDQLRRTSGFGLVECGFLDEEPSIASVLDTVRAEHVVLVPFFVAEGWHTRSTIPQDLGLEGAVTVRDGMTLWYTPPVGTMDEISATILAICSDNGAVLGPPSRVADREPQTELARARSSFLERLAMAPPDGIEFLQLRIEVDAARGQFRLRNARDSGLTEESLIRYCDPEAALEVARATGSGAYRPLRFAADLRHGWILTGLNVDGLWRALDLLYPGAVLHWSRMLQDRIETVPFTRWAARQTGIYSGVRDLPLDRLSTVVRSCCERRECLRTRSWEAEELKNTGNAVNRVPCVEPCTLFAGAARELLDSNDACHSRPASSA
ncbi:MAG: CbiX/SirB N-terminal domain-containing protein [Gemmatimonadota bacterium]